MPLNLSSSDADFVPYLKYNAKAGRFYVKPKDATEEVEIERPRLAFDMANIRTGWLYYAEGTGPEKVWDPSRTQAAPRPPGPKKFKRGFEVMVFGNDPVLPGGGTLGMREFASTANNVISTIVQMFNEYEAGAPAHPGCVPFYACTGVKAVSGAYGTNYEPRFELKGWVERSKIPAFDEHAERVPDSPPDYGIPPGTPDDYGAPEGGYTPLPRNGYGDIDDHIPF
jgi:hypothetical protein